MPFKKRRTRLVRMLGVAALALVALPSTALAGNCTDRPDVAQAFLSIDNDLNFYFAAPGGTFENRSLVQTTGGTTFVAADHGNVLAGPTAAQLPDASTVTTGSFCVDVNRPHTRFAVKSLRSNGTLLVEAVPADGSAPVALGSLNGSDYAGQWGATPPLVFDPLGLTLNTSRKVSLRLSSTDGGAWLVDGVAVDPYRR